MREFRPVDPEALGISSGHVEIDTSVAHPARVYDYALGGKDNYPADRELADKLMSIVPTAPAQGVANREFLRRAVRYAARQGVTQFLDIGTGIPTVGPTHETAQNIRPDARVLYVDNDPIVLAHARALLVEDNRTTVIQADVRDPATILARARDLFDLEQPIALMFIALLHFIPEDDDVDGLLAEYRDALPAGSMLLLSHVRDTHDAREAQKVYKASAPLIIRNDDRIRDLFAGWDILDPGVVSLHEWRPDGDETAAVDIFAGGVGVKTHG